MQFRPKFRLIFHIATAVAVALCAAPVAGAAQNGAMRHGGVGGRPGMPATQSSGPHQEHLSQWMDRHSNLTLAEQQRALQNEPGFRDQPPQIQQRMLDRLKQLNTMPPENRRRLLDRAEAMEHLTVPQRQQVAGAMQQFRSLSPDRRRIVSRAFRELREMPLEQRQAILSSDRFRGQLSEQERSTLSGLLAVEAYIPYEHPVGGAGAGR